MENAETLVENGITRFGLHVAHIMSLTGRVNAERWMHLVPGEAWDRCSLHHWREDKMMAHHLYLCWKAREAAMLRVLKWKPFAAGVYWIGKDGMTVRQAAGEAACIYEMQLGGWPDTVVLRKLPKGAAGEIDIWDGQRLRVRQAEWGIDGCVVVCRETELPMEAVCAMK